MFESNCSQVFRNRLLKGFCNIILSLAGIVIACLLVEGGARILACFQSPLPQTHKEFRQSRPLPYQHSAYFSKAFIEEQFLQPGGWSTPPGTRLVIPKDFRGQFYTITNGQRRTTDQPSATNCRILIFGGSTIYNAEVPDEHTVASILQRHINKATRSLCRVENFGTTSVTAAQQLERLRTISLSASDHIIFYDGVNDIFQGIYFNRPEGWIVGQNRDALAQLPLVTRSITRFLGEHVDRLQIFKLLYSRVFDPSLDGRIHHLYDPNLIQDAISHTAAIYSNSLAQAAHRVASYGAHFYHFYQPNLFSRGSLTPYEQSLTENRSIVSPGQKVAFLAATNALRDVSKDLTKEGIDSSDLSSLFNERDPNIEFFLDVCHVTELGNSLIANAFFEKIAYQLDSTGATVKTVSVR